MHNVTLKCTKLDWILKLTNNYIRLQIKICVYIQMLSTTTLPPSDCKTFPLRGESNGIYVYMCLSKFVIADMNVNAFMLFPGLQLK